MDGNQGKFPRSILALVVHSEYYSDMETGHEKKKKTALAAKNKGIHSPKLKAPRSQGTAVSPAQNIPVSLNAEAAEIIAVAGICNDEPSWDDLMQAIEEYRREVDAYELLNE